MIRDLKLNLSMKQLTELLEVIGNKVNLNIELNQSSGVKKVRFKSSEFKSIPEHEEYDEGLSNEEQDEYLSNSLVDGRPDFNDNMFKDMFTSESSDKPAKARRRRFGKHTRIRKKHLELREQLNIAYKSGRLSAPSMRRVQIKDCSLFDRKTKNFLLSLGYITLADVTKSSSSLILGACSSLKLSDYVTRSGLAKVVDSLEQIGVFLRK